MSAIASLPDFEIYRWDAWKRSKNYFSDLHKVRTLYNTNAEFRDAIDEAINEIWVRRDISPDRKEEFFTLSKDYLLEETAAFSIIYDTFKGVSAYPGSFQEMWKMFIGSDVPGAPEGLKHSHCLRIDFSRRI